MVLSRHSDVTNIIIFASLKSRAYTYSRIPEQEIRVVKGDEILGDRFI
ncbi:MAG: hypothetical protein HXS44_16305 [Theionarchaea archaeon]|nr:hypothetical protein [Theionarchaea archaeon]